MTCDYKPRQLTKEEIEDIENWTTSSEVTSKLNQQMFTACYDCGLLYSSNTWADVIVPNSIWKLISPTGHDGGLLCFNCINRRCKELDLYNVPFQITSGPMSFWINK